MSDGCSGVPDWMGSAQPCINHDKAYFYGGTVEDKMIDDDRLYTELLSLGFPWTWGYARVRYNGVRWLLYNYPPGHAMRSSQVYLEAFNWKGPGPPRLG